MTRRDVRQWLEDLSRKKTAFKYPGGRKPRRLARQTVKNTLNLLRVCLASALDDELIRENAARDVRVARELRTDEPWTYLTPEEQSRLFACGEIPEPDRLLIQFAVGTGLRKGEQWSLELRDLIVTGDNPHVVIRFGSPGKPPKNGKTRRAPLFGLGLDAARRWLKLLPAYARGNERRLAFPTARGCCRHKRPYRKWRAHLEHAGITRAVRWHDLRHTCASSLVAGWWGRTWRLEEVRDMLGHSSVKVTERYAHLAHSALVAAARETPGTKVTSWSREGLSSRHCSEGTGSTEPEVGSSNLPGRAGETIEDFREGEREHDLRVTAARFLIADAEGRTEEAAILARELARVLLGAT